MIPGVDDGDDDGLVSDGEEYVTCLVYRNTI